MQNHQLRLWFEKDSHLCRIVGGLGIGKTILSLFLVEQIEKRNIAEGFQIFVYFFFDHAQPKRRLASQLLRSMIRQLLIAYASLSRYVEPILKKKGDHAFEEENLSEL